jgi:hypothetical protein
MKLFTSILALSSLAAAEKGHARHEKKIGVLKGNKGGGKKGKTHSLTLTIVNESFNLPFGGFFVVAHNEYA